ncbi:MAG: bifunctional oligoribonuclease/PAP phosphatase NrnA [Clostridiales bacterium]|nr:bifunctional oligoribonuclease/PAP phosphatase NrnA [Clostridiales bacterium]
MFRYAKASAQAIGSTLYYLYYKRCSNKTQVFLCIAHFIKTTELIKVRMTVSMFESIIKEILAFDTIILHRHSRPDGDAMGSQLGLKHFLKENFPDKRIYAVGDDAGFFRFMADSEMDEIPDSMYSNALAIILDCGAPALISDDRYSLAQKTARIDHHIFCGKIADEEVIDSTFESCCGLVTQLAMESGWKMNRAAAQALYTGMLTDSGRFRYDSTSARTFRLAAFLMEQEFDTNEIFRELYADDFENKKRKALFLLKTQFTPNRVAYIYTTQDELREMNVSTFTASRGMVNTMADIRGTEIWVNFTETEEGVLCELRSSGVNINPIAVKYGGGGHAKASGATVPNRETAMQMLHDLDILTGESHE